MSALEPSPPSPRWSSTTKLVVGFSFVVIVIALLYIFRTIIGPVMLAFILAFLLHPLIRRISQNTRLSWRAIVNLIYLVIITLVAFFLTISGLAIVQQAQNLIQVVDNFIGQIPEIATELQNRTFTLGPLPFQFSLSQFDLAALSNQVLGYLQPALGRVGGLVSGVVTGAATVLGWSLFVLVISYFLLAETRNVSNEMITVNIPGYNADLRRMGVELSNIWNSFLRGQMIIFILVFILYTILMSILGVQYALAIAILAGIGRFVPYIGPLVVWIVIAVVTLLQGGNYFNLPAWQFTLLAIGLGILTDQILDNLVTPRFMGQTLGVHPAVVLIAALVLARLIGLIGLLVAAPVVATFTLVGRYISRKMLDLDPWPIEQRPTRVMEFPWVRFQRQVKVWMQKSKRVK